MQIKKFKKKNNKIIQHHKISTYLVSLIFNFVEKAALKFDSGSSHYEKIVFETGYPWNRAALACIGEICPVMQKVKEIRTTSYLLQTFNSSP